MANIQFKDIRKSYGDVAVVHGISLDIRDGEFIVIVGPSGCGKSTLLRMVAVIFYANCRFFTRL